MSQEQELLRKVDLMRRCYLKGFCNKNYAIGVNAQVYIENLAEPETANKAKDIAFTCLTMMTEAHAKLPFAELYHSPDFAPVIVTRDLLQDQEQSVKKFFQSPDEDELDRILYNGTTIWRVGELFRANFKRSLRELQTIPQHKNYQFELTDLNGRKWSSWEIGI